MHKLLERQIRRYLPEGRVPPGLQPLLDAIDQAYRDSDTDRALLERSLDLTSKELSARYQRLRQEQRDHQIIFESAPAMIFHKDGDNRILRVNEMGAQALGRPVHELEGKSCYELFPPEVARQLHADDLDVIRTGEPKLGIVESHPGAAGEPVWFRTDKVPYHDASGKVIGVLVFSIDITDQKKAQEQVSLANRQLEDLVRFRTQFLNTTAHELRTPLTPILLQSHLLREGLWERSDDLHRRGFEILSRNVKRLDRLVNDVLDAARLQSGRLQLRRSRIDMGKLVTDAVETFQPVAVQSRIGLELTPTPTLVLDGDPSRLTQVLYNLLSNALNFTPAGGKVVVECAARDGDCVVTVRDTGIGITAAQQARLFQPFTQLHDTMQRTRGGTGLGLYVSKGIVEQHGGHIACYSAGANAGSTFTFSLPRPVSEAVEGPAAPDADELPVPAPVSSLI